MYDIRKMFGIFLPPTPFVCILCTVCPQNWGIFWHPYPPQCGRHIWKPTYGVAAERVEEDEEEEVLSGMSRRLQGILPSLHPSLPHCVFVLLLGWEGYGHSVLNPSKLKETKLTWAILFIILLESWSYVFNILNITYTCIFKWGWSLRIPAPLGPFIIYAMAVSKTACPVWQPVREWVAIVHLHTFPESSSSFWSWTDSAMALSPSLFLVWIHL